MNVNQTSDPAQSILGSPLLVPICDAATQSHFTTCNADLYVACVNLRVLSQRFIHVVLNKIIGPLITERSEPGIARQAPGTTAE